VTYYLTLSYDEKQDEFFSFVDQNDPNDETFVFSIDSTEEMLDLINTGVMDHVDDVDGLLKHLQNQAILGADDVILVNEQALP
jgi:hypothetical protein